MEKLKELFVVLSLSCIGAIISLIIGITCEIIINSYCDSISISCNISNINNTIKWFPKGDQYNDFDCPYFGDNDDININDYDIVDCYYDSNYECPSDTCGTYLGDHPARIGEIFALSLFCFTMFILTIYRCRMTYLDQNEENEDDRHINHFVDKLVDDVKKRLDN